MVSFLLRSVMPKLFSLSGRLVPVRRAERRSAMATKDTCWSGKAAWDADLEHLIAEDGSLTAEESRRIGAQIALVR